MRSFREWTLVSGVALLAGALPTPQVASAADDSVPTELVRFSDLNLGTSAGVQVLYGRLRAAAHVVCAPLEPVGTRIPSAAWSGCIDQAIASAVQRVDRPLLTGYYQRMATEARG